MHVLIKSYRNPGHFYMVHMYGVYGGISVQPNLFLGWCDYIQSFKASLLLIPVMAVKFGLLRTWWYGISFILTAFIFSQSTFSSADHRVMSVDQFLGRFCQNLFHGYHRKNSFQGNVLWESVKGVEQKRSTLLLIAIARTTIVVLKGLCHLFSA